MLEVSDGKRKKLESQCPLTLHLNYRSRVEVVSNKNVEPFGPPIPSPPQFFDELELREFLLLKCKYMKGESSIRLLTFVEC